MHAKAARRAGESEERLFAVGAWRDAPYFSDAERAALALTEALTRVADRAGPVPDPIWDAAAEHFDEEQLGALVLTSRRSTSGTASTSRPSRWPARGNRVSYPTRTRTARERPSRTGSAAAAIGRGADRRRR